MIVASLLAYLRENDVVLWAEGGRLRYSAPKGVLTPALRAALVEQKAEIIEILQADVMTDPAPASLVPPSKGERELPLSFAQQGLWFLGQLAPGSSNYTIPGAIRLSGLLNVVALARSLNEIVRRHEALRTAFLSVEGRPVPVIVPTLTVPLPLRDLSALPEARREAEAWRLFAEEAQQPLDLTRGPLVRASLVRLGTKEHVLQLSTHHIIFDGWSMGIFVRELAALYEVFITGEPSVLPLPLHQYADYALWQWQWLEGEDCRAQVDYWRQQLAGMPSLLDLPTDRPRPPVRTFQDACYTCKLSRALTEGIKILSQQEGVTLFMTLLAAFLTLLYRYTGQVDLVVGTPIANRTQAAFEGLIGCFVNTLVLRTSLAGNPTFRELLGRVREVALGAYMHQELPFERLVEAMVPQRHPSYAPLVQVMFVLQNAPMPTFEVAGLRLCQWRIEDGTNQFDLTNSMVEDLLLSMVEVEGELTAVLKYKRELFDEATISRMMGHLKTLLESVIAHPGQSISTLPFLTEVEHRRMLIEWNDTGAPYPGDVCIHHLFEGQAERTPDAVAVVFEGGQLLYHELNRRANQLAHRLEKLGVGPEKLVGIFLERSFEMIVGILGIFKAGGAFVALDPAYPEERLAFMLQDTQAPVLLTQQRLLERLPEHNAVVISLDVDWEAIAEESIANPVSCVEPDNLAYVICTSGSTGRPKGTLVPHRGLCNLVEEQRATFGIRPARRVLQFASLSFDAAIWEIVMTLSAGATLCLGTQDSLIPGKVLIDLLQVQAITTMVLPPSVWSALPTADLPALETCIFSGEACTSELVERWEASRRLFNAYGPTEATVYVTVAACRRDGERPLIGHPIINTQIYLLDAQLQPMPVGIPGEMYIGGVGLARGYLNQPGLTAERFIAHPYSTVPGARLYKTGDLARYCSDGSIDFLGRLDQQVKLRGYRIELGEIETTLTEHPAVREAIVLAREDVAGDVHLTAYVSPHAQQRPTAAVLRSFLRSKLPAYMVPSSLVVLDALPLTPNNKVDRRALAKLGDVYTELAAVHVAPQTATERVIAEIWQEVLHRERIGIHDNFFDSGGHSLLLARVHSELLSTLNKDISMIDLLRYPTISSLAKYVNQGQSEEVTFQQSYDRAEMHRTSTQRQRSIRHRH
jgi:amino acid adenylation domain-containing protein